MQATDPLLPLVDAVQAATGRRPHLSTVLRWCQRPNRHGIRLRSRVVGGRRLTTVAAVLQYIDATTEAADSPVLSDNTNRQRYAAHEQALRNLDEMGV